jgi:cytoskeletal protein CcmA (bactofilin family)
MPDKAKEHELETETNPVRPVTQPVAKPATPLLPRFGAEPAHALAPRTDKDGSQVNDVEVGTLIIGREISFIGQITACNRLVIEGIVEASLQGCQEVLIGETGFFKGQARTENAEVSGRMEGELIVRKRLLIRAAGHVSGTTTYGEIEIERGGRIVGETQAREGARPGGGW